MVVTYLHSKIEVSEITMILQFLSRNHNTVLDEIEFLKGKNKDIKHNTCF
jgi:hypothetical protein